MLETLPPRTRCIAISPRGHSPSSPFSPEDLASGVHLVATLGHDLAALLVYLVQSLSLPVDSGNAISLLGWSFGNMSILSAYHLLSKSPSPLNAEERVGLSTYVSQYICYESPEIAMAVPESPERADAQAEMSRTFREILTSPEDRNRGEVAAFDRFLASVSAYYHHESMSTAEHSPKPQRPLTDDKFLRQQFLDGCTCPAAFVQIALAKPRYAESQPEASAALTTALQAVVNCKVMVLQIVTERTAPACRNGMLEMKRQMRALDVGGAGWHRRTIVGDYNHYLHNHAPNVLWKALETEGRSQLKQIHS